MEKEKTGLVLEGGAMRGIYTAGVLDVLMEHDIYLDGVIGVSAGAIHGCSYASHQKGRSIRYYQKYRSDKRFMGFWNLFHGGDIVGTEFCYHTIPEKLDPYDYEGFEKYGMPFYAVCTDIEDGTPQYIQVKDMKEEIDVIRASASMPFVSRVVNFRGQKLLDGGCSDSIPVRAMQKLGFPRNVVVLTRPEDYVKKPMKNKVMDTFYHKYPAFTEVLKNRHKEYNECIKDIQEMEKTGEIFVIRPSVDLKIGRMEENISRIQLVYYYGRKDALKKLDELKAWLKSGRAEENDEER